MRRKVISTSMLSIVAILIIVIGVLFNQSKQQSTVAESEASYLENLDYLRQIEIENKSNDTIVLPNSMYILENQGSMFINANSIVKGDLTDFNIAFNGEPLTDNNGGWEITTDSLATMESGSTITLEEKLTEDVLSKKINIEQVPVDNEDSINLLNIGDSMTRTNTYGKTIQSILPNVQTVGSRTFDDGISNGEGRGGWSLRAYITRIGHESGLDSPFIYPVGVEASKFHGNSEFWKQVIYDDPEGYHFEGFQNAARDIDSQEYLYNRNGYPLYPESDDVIVDPNLPEGENFLEYDGENWQVMSPQPETEFNYTSYIEKYIDLFNGKEPNYINILLGANDYTPENGLNSKQFIQELKVIIESVKNHDIENKIIISLPIIGNTADVFEDTESYSENMQILANELIKEFDEKQSENIFVSSTNAVIGPENLVDEIHPNEDGYSLMGKNIAALLQKIKNDY